jgi:hypothetical protein
MSNLCIGTCLLELNVTTPLHMDKFQVCWKDRKLQCTTFSKGMIHKKIGEKNKFERSEVWGQIRKASLSDITNIFNDSENINACKKTSVDVYSREGVSSVRMQEGKQDGKKRVTWRKQKRRLPYLMIGKKWFFSDESRLWMELTIESIWRKSDETFRPACICPGINRKISIMI